MDDLVGAIAADAVSRNRRRQCDVATLLYAALDQDVGDVCNGLDRIDVNQNLDRRVSRSRNACGIVGGREFDKFSHKSPFKNAVISTLLHKFVLNHAFCLTNNLK